MHETRGEYLSIDWVFALVLAETRTHDRPQPVVDQEDIPRLHPSTHEACSTFGLSISKSWGFELLLSLHADEFPRHEVCWKSDWRTRLFALASCD